MANDHPIDVRYVASLARLELTEEETATFQPQLDAILEYVESLSALDVEGLEPMAHPVPVFDVLRPDTPVPGLPPEGLLQNAPEQAQNQVRVPKVIADA